MQTFICRAPDGTGKRKVQQKRTGGTLAEWAILRKRKLMRLKVSTGARMRDDTPAVRALLASLAGYGDGYVSYRPKLNDVTGSGLGTLLLLRMLMRWEHAGRQPFVKFSEPVTDNPAYKKGQSWTEEMNWTRRELDTAVGSISTRLQSGRSVQQEVNRLGSNPKTMIIRWQDGHHRMWWEVIEPVAGRLIAEVYARWTEPVRPVVQPEATAAATEAQAGKAAPADPEGHISHLMGVLYEVTGTYGNRGREARAAKEVAAAIRRGDYSRETARDALIDLRDDPGWHGPKGWPEVLTRMTNFLPRWRAAQTEQPPPRPNGNAQPSVQVTPPAPRYATGSGAVYRSGADQDAEVLGSRDYSDLEH